VFRMLLPCAFYVMLFKIWMHILEELRLHKWINIPLSISVQPILVTIVIRVV
jgi:hypothetical protein